MLRSKVRGQCCAVKISSVLEQHQEEVMKTTFCVVAGIVVAAVLYSMAPDIVRYIKIKSM